MYIGKTAAIVGGVLSTATVSTAVLAGTLGSGKKGKYGPNDVIIISGSLDPAKVDAFPLMSFKKSFDTRNANEGDDQPPLTINKGGCFEAFFPETALTRPTNAVNKGDLSNVLPSNFQFDDTGPKPMGCRLMKLSETKQGKLFGYLSESTVFHNELGLAFYVSVTNTKTKNSVAAEYWILFLKKNGDKWTVSDSRYWAETKQISESGDFRMIFFENPDNQMWTVELKTEPATDLDSFFTTSKESRSGLWKDEDRVYAGVWSVDEGSWNNTYFFAKDSYEASVLRDHFDGSSAAATDPVALQQKIKFTNQGSWQTVEQYCPIAQSKEETDRTEVEKRGCFGSNE